MSEFAAQTVAQLKELLKKKGLSTDGKKADLVQRLEESEIAVVEETTEVPTVTAEQVAPETVVAEVNAPEETAAAPAATGEVAVASEAAAEAKVEEEPKILTADERKQLAVELYQKKIARAEKFGDEEGATEAKKVLARVEKFGVELGTALAREIGLVDRSLGNGHGKFKKHFKPNHKKNNKNNRKTHNKK